MRKFKTLSLLVASGLYSTLSWAQGEPTKPSYEKVVYQRDGKTYVQKSLPVYLKFSVTPDGKNYPLTSLQHPSDANPVYLDTEGLNYIRSRWAVDPKTGKPVSPQREVQMELFADGMAPRTRHAFSGAPKYTSGGTVYFGKGLTFTLTASDGVSGVKETQYSLNGNYTKYNGSVTANKEGSNTLYYYSADHVGNAETTRSSAFTVDLSAPTSSHAIDGIVYNNTILAPSTKFRLSSNDNLAGVRTTYYSFDTGSDRYYGSPVTMAGLEDGEHTLHYYAVDNVKNEATKSTFKFYLDKIAPVVNHSIVGDQYKGRYMYVSSRTKIDLSATDNKAGVKNIYYRIDGKERFTFSNSFNLPNTLGVHTVKYDANDNVENLAANKFITVFVDNAKPTTAINYGNPQFFHRDTLFINKTTPITLTARDGHSGIKSTMYTVDGGSMKAYAKFNIEQEGFHTITFKSTDNVNNEEQTKSSNVFVDNTAPEIFVNFSIDPIGTKKGLKVYPEYVRMYIGATDKHVGTARILYSVDGENLKDYSSPQTLDLSEVSSLRKNKKYTVKVVSRDKLGNESEQTFEFYIGRGE